MEDLTRHFDPYAMAEPKSESDLALLLEEVNTALAELNAMLGEMETVMRKINDA